MLIKRNEEEFIEVKKKHTLVCEKCEGSNLIKEFSKEGIIIRCGYCGEKEVLSCEEYDKLISELFEIRKVSLEEFYENIKLYTDQDFTRSYI